VVCYATIDHKMDLAKKEQQGNFGGLLIEQEV
jgi:hypothetical protein